MSTQNERTAEDLMDGIARAIKDRNWVALEGLMKALAVVDPARAQIILSVLEAKAS